MKDTKLRADRPFQSTLPAAPADAPSVGPQHSGPAMQAGDPSLAAGAKVSRATPLSGPERVAPKLEAVLDELSARYLALHTAKEDLFWAAKMGLSSDPKETQEKHDKAEIALNQFRQDPARLRELRALRTADTSDPLQKRLEGWLSYFSAHTIDSPKARKLAEEIVELEGALQERRRAMKLGYTDPKTGAFVPASSNKLALMLRSEPDEAVRRAAYEGLKSIEDFVLDAGFLDLVKKRNELGRAVGYDDYYDWRTSVVEGMRKSQVFALLDDLALRTEARAKENLAAFAKKHGPSALEPWNFHFLRAGSITRELDPYFSFASSLERWGQSFYGMGIRYKDATLTLDLVERPGKYENGFMHGPGPAFFDHGKWQAARINFTANAVPGAMGAGLAAVKTLFHEGGHGAHFSSITMDAPCYSQEFAPTSVAYAETQSMFCDSVITDADWRARYALDKDGKPMPLELIERALRESQPFAGWEIRAMMTVPQAERALYEMTDAELTKENVREKLAAIERTMQGTNGAARPVLAVPHLLSGESSAYYHGYVLAEMGVYQTREYFLTTDGYITDNPKVGPALAEAYWSKGNSVGFSDTLKRLTGKPLSADALVAHCNQTTEEACAAARAAVAASAQRPRPQGPVQLDAHVRIMHGNELIADTKEQGFAEACARFRDWIDGLEAKAKREAAST